MNAIQKVFEKCVPRNLATSPKIDNKKRSKLTTANNNKLFQNYFLI